MSGIAGADALALLDGDVRLARDEVLAGLTVVAGDDDLPHALGDRPVRHRRRRSR